MYLSRMYLNAQLQDTRRLLSNPQRLHREIMSLVPPAFDDAPASHKRILWRLDFDGPQPLLYTLTPQQPDFTHMQEQYGWSKEKSWQTADYDVLLNKLAAGQTYHFRLVANPVHKIRLANGSEKIVSHVTEAQQIEWLLSRAERVGFKIPLGDAGTPAVVRTTQLKLRFHHGKQSSVQFNKVQFDGVLEITDLEAFRQTLCQGIGREKAYGCGLLTISPLNH